MPISYFKKRGKEPVPAFGGKFESALRQFSVGFLNSESFKHALTKGEEREIPVRGFFKDHLPETYAVTSGEVVDLGGNHSPQLDLLIFDKLRNFSFYSGYAAVLPAEALLVSVEIKSLITKDEVKKSLKAAETLRKLKPFRMALFKCERGDEPERLQCRYFHCLFAYNTDLAEMNWLEKEYARVLEVAKEVSSAESEIDRTYVANRGLINPGAKTGLLEDSRDGHALMSFYMHILNFLTRENSRREPVPYLDYAGRMSQGWQKL